MSAAPVAQLLESGAAARSLPGNSELILATRLPFLAWCLDIYSQLSGQIPFHLQSKPHEYFMPLAEVPIVLKLIQFRFYSAILIYSIIQHLCGLVHPVVSGL